MYSGESNSRTSLRLWAVLCFAGVALLLTACRTPPDIPVRDGYYIDISKLKNYKVRKGDTLYSIAWHLGRDYREIAAVNKIKHPYSIYPGQILSLSKSEATQDSVKSSSSKKITTTSVKLKKQSKIKASSIKSQASSRVNWQWPANGSVISRFSNKGIGNKGLDISGNQGDAVRAAASGKVVYRGDALLGYGRIVIIKHNDQFLSAYAHNNQILVKEEQWVKAGQLIAEIGSTGTNRNKLHFEIRREGTPVDPLRYLPRRK